MLDVPIDPRKANLVSAAIERYALRSILDIGACWGVHGGYTFHAMKSGRIERAVIADGDVTTLTRVRAAADPRIRTAEGNIGDAGFIDALPPSDAAIIFDVLLHQVAPDWDAFLARYARKVNHFIIWNQDWIGSEQTVRFVERGLDWYLENVGDTNRARIIEWFARHDEISPQFGRPWRDVHFFWQWGIVSTDLIARHARARLRARPFRQFRRLVRTAPEDRKPRLSVQPAVARIPLTSRVGRAKACTTDTTQAPARRCPP